jgi:hypothetical protein
VGGTLETEAAGFAADDAENGDESLADDDYQRPAPVKTPAGPASSKRERRRQRRATRPHGRAR